VEGRIRKNGQMGSLVTACLAQFPRNQYVRLQWACHSKHETIQIAYDNYPFLLKEEIVDRNGPEKKYFESTELWYLAFTVIEAAHSFHSTGKKIGDVRPLNIFINDNGQTKVANQCSWPGE
jgi:serine/threonine protein kinase